MRRVQVVLFAALALMAALVLTFALRNRQPPYLPDDLDHGPAVPGESCDHCHGPDGAFPRGANHPNGVDCRRCHGRR